MKKLALTIAIVLTMGLNVFAQYDEDKYGIQPWFESGLLGRGDASSGGTRGDGDPSFLLPGSHGGSGDASATPLGSGIAVLVGLGAAYMVAKKRKED